MILTFAGLPHAFQWKRAVLNADSFASAPPDVRKTASIAPPVRPIRVAPPGVIAGMFDEPAKPEQ